VTDREGVLWQLGERGGKPFCACSCLSVVLVAGVLQEPPVMLQEASVIEASCDSAATITTVWESPHQASSNNEGGPWYRPGRQLGERGCEVFDACN